MAKLKTDRTSRGTTYTADPLRFTNRPTRRSRSVRTTGMLTAVESTDLIERTGASPRQSFAVASSRPFASLTSSVGFDGPPRRRGEAVRLRTPRPARYPSDGSVEPRTVLGFLRFASIHDGLSRDNN